MRISISKAVLDGSQALREGGIADGRREAISLLAHSVCRDRTFVLTHGDDFLEGADAEAFRKLIARRVTGEPVQYITGRQAFFELEFEVTPEVLIPRPETELIVEITLELLKDETDPSIADIGTGSGCIAISILHELPKARAIAVENSPGALRIAKCNAETHAIIDRLTLIESDCFEALIPQEQFSLITSNPPYIRDDEIRALQREVRHEPRAALAGGADGLDVIRRLLFGAAPFLRSHGHLVFEIGFDQNTAVDQLVDRKVWELIEIRPDLKGIARAVVLQRK